MGLVDKHIKTLINMTTKIPLEDIFNVFQLKGGLPEKICKTDKGEKILTSYTQSDIFCLFGIEEGDNNKEEVVITDSMGAPEDTIIITHKFSIKVLFYGDDSDFYSLKFKARLWSKKAVEYLEENNITILTQNPEITFETEEISGEFWSQRGIKFNIVIELNFKDDEENLIEKESSVIIYKGE